MTGIRALWIVPSEDIARLTRKGAVPQDAAAERLPGAVGGAA
jgi:hypothetical protein